MVACEALRRLRFHSKSPPPAVSEVSRRMAVPLPSGRFFFFLSGRFWLFRLPGCAPLETVAASGGMQANHSRLAKANAAIVFIVASNILLGKNWQRLASACSARRGCAPPALLVRPIQTLQHQDQQAQSE